MFLGVLINFATPTSETDLRDLLTLPVDFLEIFTSCLTGVVVDCGAATNFSDCLFADFGVFAFGVALAGVDINFRGEIFLSEGEVHSAWRLNGDVLLRGLGGRDEDNGETKTSKDTSGVLADVKDQLEVDLDLGDGVENISGMPS